MIFVAQMFQDYKRFWGNPPKYPPFFKRVHPNGGCCFDDSKSGFVFSFSCSVEFQGCLGVVVGLFGRKREWRVENGEWLVGGGLGKMREGGKGVGRFTLACFLSNLRFLSNLALARLEARLEPSGKAGNRPYRLTSRARATRPRRLGERGGGLSANRREKVWTTKDTNGRLKWRIGR